MTDQHALHNTLRNLIQILMLGLATKGTTCSFDTNLGVTKFVLVVNQLSLSIPPYIHVKPHIDIHSNYVGFVIIAE